MILEKINIESLFNSSLRLEDVWSLVEALSLSVEHRRKQQVTFIIKACLNIEKGKDPLDVLADLSLNLPVYNNIDAKINNLFWNQPDDLANQDLSAISYCHEKGKICLNEDGVRRKFKNILDFARSYNVISDYLGVSEIEFVDCEDLYDKIATMQNAIMSVIDFETDSGSPLSNDRLNAIVGS